MVTQRSGPSRPGVTRTYSPPPCPGRTAPSSTGSGRSRSTWCCSSTPGLPWAHGRLHRRRPVLRALRLPRHQRAPQRDRRDRVAAARPLLRTTGPPAAPGRARRHRRDQPAVRADRLLGPPGRRSSATRRARCSTSPTGTSWPRAATTSPPTSTRARSCTSGPSRSRSSTTSSSRCSSWRSAGPRGAAPSASSRPCSRCPLGSQLVWAQLDSRPRLLRHRRPPVPAARRLAVRRRDPHLEPPRGARTAGSIAVAGLVGVVVLGSGLVDLSASLRGVGATVASALVISGLVLDGSTRPARLLARRPGLPRPDLLRHLPLALAGDPRRHDAARRRPRGRRRPGPRGGDRAGRRVVRGAGDADPAVEATRPDAVVPRRRRRRGERAGRGDRRAVGAAVGPTPRPRGSRRGQRPVVAGADPAARRPGRHRLERRPRGPRQGGLLRRPHRREVHRRHGTGTARAAGRRQPGADARPDVRADREGARADAVAQRPCRLPVAGGADQPQGLARGPAAAARTPASGGTTTCCRSCGRTWSSSWTGHATTPRSGRTCCSGGTAGSSRSRPRPARRAGPRCARSPPSCPAPCWWSASSCRRPSTRPSACPPSSARAGARCGCRGRPRGPTATTRPRPPGHPGRHARPQPGLLPLGPGVRRGGRRPGGVARRPPPHGALRRRPARPGVADPEARAPGDGPALRRPRRSSVSRRCRRCPRPRPGPS